MNILLAIDSSPPGNAAAQFIQNIEFPHGSSLHLLKVVDPKHLVDVSSKKPKKKNTSSGTSVQSHETDKAWQLMNQLCQRMEDPTRETIPLVSVGNPGAEILSVIEHHKIDLVVLGTHSRRGLNRFLLGSVSEWIVTEAPCSTLIIRGKTRTKKSKGMNILLASDGSPDADTAVRFLKSVEFPQSSKLTLLHVVKKHFYQTEQLVTTIKKTSSDFVQSAEDLLQERGREGAELLENIRTMVQETGLNVNEHLAFGYEADEILKCAKRIRADLIILGSKGVTNLRKFLLGSVSSKIVRHAPCSVLVVR
ncbi:MAG: universal stress protein [Nitrospirales bacterium]|nr:MAG: universal stress protein [Nitrospirales bacterium]